MVIGLVKKKWKVWCSKSCCTARPMKAATTTTPSSPSTVIVCASAYGAFTKTLSLLKMMLADWMAPAAAAIHIAASAVKTMKYTYVDRRRILVRNSNQTMALMSRGARPPR